VLSKSTEVIDRTQKLPIYARHGVAHVWLIDPIAKTLEVHALVERHVRLYEGDVRVRAAPFEAVELDLSALWSGPHT
jgi:Uma2 family endonuclease